MSRNWSSIALILLYFIHLSELVLADDKDSAIQNKVDLKWHLSDDFDNRLLYLQWKILDSDYFGRIDHYVVKWNYTKVSCNKSEAGEWQIAVDQYSLNVRVQLYERYSIIFCVESDKVTCENFSKPFQQGDIATKIASEISKYEIPEVRHDKTTWENMKLNIYFEEVNCRVLQGPLEIYYKVVCEEDNESDDCSINVSNVLQYPLENNHMVITNLVPYHKYNISIYLVRKVGESGEVFYNFPFAPDYGVVTEAIRNLSVTSKGPDHIALRWLPPYPPSDTLNEYYVYVATGRISTSKGYVINIEKCAQWAEYHCHIATIADEGHYNILNYRIMYMEWCRRHISKQIAVNGVKEELLRDMIESDDMTDFEAIVVTDIYDAMEEIFALNRYDPDKVNLQIELEHAAKKHLQRNVETDISGSKSRKNSIDECKSVTKVSNQAKVCPGDTIIDYKFSSDPVDSAVWTVEQYISGDPDWAFNIYRSDVVSVQNNGLHIKPKLEETLAKTNLDLNPGCTQDPKKCHRDFVSVWNPPVVSGQLRSKKSFCFGNITIRAKLPIGDYMYPELYIEDVSNPRRRLLVAYARGNLDYMYINGLDDGGTKLFGGPHTDIKEPGKFRYLSTYVNSEHMGASWHTFNVIWSPDKIELYLDGHQFGHYNSHTIQATGFDKEKLVRLILGIGVGGPYHFPDGYTSSNKKKPYRSFSKSAIKNFVENKIRWHNTWNEDSQLLVDFVTVTAL